MDRVGRFAKPVAARVVQRLRPQLVELGSNHFARVICDKVTENGLEESLMRPVIAVTEEMLSELPEWRKNLGGLEGLHEPDHAARRRLVGPRAARARRRRSRASSAKLSRRLVETEATLPAFVNDNTLARSGPRSLRV